MTNKIVIAATNKGFILSGDDKIDNFDYSNNYSAELMNLTEKVLNMNNVYKVVTNNCYDGLESIETPYSEKFWNDASKY